MNTTLNLVAAASITTLLVLCSCSPRSHEMPVQGSLQNGGGSSTGSMAYPAPAPQGNLVTTPNR